MKILVTGSNSYIGTNLEKYLSQWPNDYSVDTVSTLDDSWMKKSFSKYNIVFHVAAIVHQKEKSSLKDLYYKVNKDLAVKAAKKAKAEGVDQFIFMSTMRVYGKKSKIGEKALIDKNTPCEPTTFYGKSKLEAEIELNALSNEKFKVVILRPPMVYGQNSRGNYLRLRNLILKVPVFPNINNQRSMIFIDNLTEFIRQIMINGESGLFFPQNREYVNTVKMVELIAKENSKRIYLSKFMSCVIKRIKLDIVTKVFGNLTYDLQLSDYNDFEYCIAEFEESIALTEKKPL